MRKCALIIETRPQVIRKIIDNHFNYLDESWELFVFGTKKVEQEIEAYFSYNMDFQNMVHFSRLPQEYCDNFSMSKYNKLLTSKEIWEILYSRDFDKVLTIQEDSKLLRKGVDSFLNWDWCGSPWGHFNLLGGNGGLSIRSVEKMLDVIDKFPYREKEHGNEDVYFCKHLPKVGGKIAPKEIAMTFGVETIFYPTPIGVHAPEKYLTKQQLESIK